MDKYDKRRDQYRYTRHDKLFVQLISSNIKHDVSSATVFCHCCDVSVHGLKAELEMQLELKSKVDLWMEFEGLDRKFYLRGHVCWCESEAKDSSLYQTGIELEDASSTDYETWIKLLDSFSN